MVLDYSKFAHITDSDEDTPEDSHEEPASATKLPININCSNCGTSCGKLSLCGNCKSVYYCSPKCQRDDWQFHKRICKKPVPMEQALQQKFPGSICLGGTSGSREDEHQKPCEKALTKSLCKEVDAVDQSLTSTCADGETREQMLSAESEGVVQSDIDAGESLISENLTVAMSSAIAEKHSEATSQFETCKNCLQDCTKPLRCSVCKEATYCSAKCQKEDWQFHKRLCDKAKLKTTCQCGAKIRVDEMFCSTCGARRPDQVKGNSPVEPVRLRPSEAEHSTEEEVADWYRHRDWQPDVKQEFRPSLIENAENDPASLAPTKKKGSAWNAAGTWEEKSMMSWWVQKLSSLHLGWEGPDLVVVVDPIHHVSGEASMVFAGGTTRFLFELSFCIDFEVQIEETKGGYKMQTSSTGQVRISDLSHDNVQGFNAKVDGTELAVELGHKELVPKLKNALLECVADYEQQH